MNRFSLALWQCIDHVYRRVRRFDYEDMQGNNVFRVRVRHYTGPEFSLENGFEVKRGDWVGFLHLYNLRLQQMMHEIQSDNRRSILLLREVQHSLPELAEFALRHPRGHRIKALIGITLLNRGVQGLGFTVSDVPDTPWYRFRRWYMKWMIRITHPEGSKRLKQKPRELMLKRCVLTRDELFRRYGKVRAVSGIDLEG
ncbi:MAG: hypothetical protein WCC10_17600 [Tumebacillaceae bacterium]